MSLLEWNKDRKARLIAALFHDIGKFQYRAQKTKDGHWVNSGRFIREYLGRFDALKDMLDHIAQLAENHHHPSVADPYLQEADHISSSERDDEERQEARRPLLNIFQRIQGIHGEELFETKDEYFLPGPLTIEERDFFPVVLETMDDESLCSLHAPHWNGFLKEIREIPENLDFVSLADTLLALLHRWTARVSSAGYRSIPDISLYDHLRVTAAYADCSSMADDRQRPIVFIEGDLAGIQKFIYRLANPAEADQKGTAKILRGRSFLISLYCEAISRYLLDEIGLAGVHQLLIGGGRFTIIAPNVSGIENRLSEIRAQLSKWLFNEFAGEIDLILVWGSFEKEELKQYNRVRQKMLLLEAEEKLRRSRDLLEDTEFWLPSQPDDEVIRVCNQCGRYYARYEGLNRCPGCEKQRKIGQTLPHSGWIVFSKGQEIGELSEDFAEKIFIRPLSQYWYLVRKKKVSYALQALQAFMKENRSNHRLEVIKLNDSHLADILFKPLGNTKIAFSFRFLGNYTPMDETGRDVKSFHQFVENMEGDKQIGVLRMDVDSLGTIFTAGFPQGSFSVSRVATLSRLLMHFFEGFINTLAHKHEIYIAYSGGDDLFAVGAWDRVIDFAFEVREAFRKYVSRNPHVTLSGGMVVVHPGYPIRYAAERAGDEEENAKSLDSGDSRLEKNAFSIFGEAYHWDRAKELIEWAKKTVKVIQDMEKRKEGKIALRSLIRYFKQLHDESFYPDGSQDPKWVPRVLHKVRYAIKRRAHVGEDEFAAGGPDPIVQLLAPIAQTPKLLEDINFPANYVLMKTRKQR